MKRALALSAQDAEAQVIEQTGERIDRYKLLEKIGEGGYGVVYMAEQAEPIRRRVALKIVKLGMDTKQVIARFEAERQALALMNHPNIAKVLDAGATVTGRPYFVMELVRGIKITNYCDQHKLSTRARLGLFIQVCHAVQHAHQKGIIHRDLKPSNILVTELDGVAVPKVIDFGIAKATGQQLLTDKTVFTAFQQFIGTPAYMSPEQAGLSGADVDTRSDIYALGVLLYELLTGHTPFERRELLQAGFDEMRRLIREEEPPKPSTRLSLLAADDLTRVAQGHATEPPRLIHLVRGDLDWIAMKALEKDRARRYETAIGFALDVQHYMDGDPVAARPPNRLYRLGKLVKRNKLVLTAAVAVFLALAIGLGFSLWSLRKATHEASKSRQVGRFLRDALRGAGPSVALGRDATILREILDNTAQRLDKDLNEEPDVQADLRDTLGEIYHEIGEYAKSESMFRKALAMRKELLGNEHPDVATSLGNLAMALLAQGELTNAETLCREALTMRKRLRGKDHQDVALSLNNLAAVLRYQNRLEESEALQREALAIEKKSFGTEHPKVATSLNNLAVELHCEGKLAEAEAMHREALAMQRKLLGTRHPDMAASLNNLATVLRAQGKLAEAEAMSRESLAMLKELLGSEHPHVADALDNLARVLIARGKLAEAETLYNDEVAILRKLRGPLRPELPTSLQNLAEVLRHQGKLAPAEPLYREAVAMRRELWRSRHTGFDDLLGSLHNLADLLAQEDKLAEAEALYREAVATRRNVAGRKDAGLFSSLDNLADVLHRQRKLAEAETFYREAVAMGRELTGGRHVAFDGLASTLHKLADVLTQEEKSTEAEDNYREALRMLRDHFGQGHPQTVGTLHNLADLLTREGKLAEAETLYREEVAIYRKQPGNAHTNVLSTIARIIPLLEGQGKLGDAEAMQREVVTMEKRLVGNEHTNVAAALNNLATALHRYGKLAEAETVHREALAMRTKLLGSEHRDVATSLCGLAFVLQAQGRLAEAENMHREAMAMRTKLLGAKHPDLALSFYGLAAVLEAQGKATEAEEPARACLKLCEQRWPHEWPVFGARHTLGCILADQKRYAEAEPLLLSAYGGMKKCEIRMPLELKPLLKDAPLRLSELYEATAQSDKAAEWKKKLAELTKLAPAASPAGTK
jgi:eukaryotic-like serine/threonine-protein kinase